MQNTLRFLRGTTLLVLFLSLVSMQMSTDETIFDKDGISVNSNYEFANESHVMNLTFSNSNDYDVVITWDNEITFENDKVMVSNGNVQGQNSLSIAANSNNATYSLDLFSVSTVLASMEVVDFKLINTNITKQ